VTTSLGLRGQTVASLQAFKKRNEDARRKVQQLSEKPTTVDFSAYRSVLKNQAIVDEIERRFKEFKPSTYDVNRQIKAIDAFEVEALKNAEATKQAVDLELKDLAVTLKNIEEARPFEDLTVVRIGVRNSHWMVSNFVAGRSCCRREVDRREDQRACLQGSLDGAGIQGMSRREKLILLKISANSFHRRSLATSPLFNRLSNLITTSHTQTSSLCVL
jgi:F-type H+-transporting ATPase subunit d